MEGRGAERRRSELRDEVSGEVAIALPAGRENLLFSNPGISIVVCGDQPDMIRRAHGAAARACVIVCQAEVPQELLDVETETCIDVHPLRSPTGRCA